SFCSTSCPPFSCLPFSCPPFSFPPFSCPISSTQAACYSLVTWQTGQFAMLHLSIVIPAYNEENRIGRTLTETFDYLDKQNYSSEVIVVNDGSTDHTAETVHNFESRAGGRLRLIENPGNRGKGYSVRNGMLHAAGEIALFFDADLATPTS